METTATSNLNILVLTWEFPPNIVGGLSRHVYGLTKSLSEQNVEIHVITANPNQLMSEEKMDGVYVHRITPLNNRERDFLTWIGGLNLAIVKKVLQLASSFKFDCIHSHDWMVGPAAIVLKKKLDVPLVTTIHATEYGRNNGIYTDMQQFIHNKEEQLARESEQIIVCSEYMKEEVEKLFHVSSDKLTVIPNGIEKEPDHVHYQKELLNGIPIDPSRKMVFSIGRIVREKGFDTILESAFKLKNESINAYFMIAGKGPMLKEYQRKVKELDLIDTVYFIDFVNDEKRRILLEICDVVIIPSLYEPFGIVALESMAAGKPTIVSNTGGLRGFVEHLKTGLFMEPGNKESLIEQIQLILNNPSLGKKIGLHGKEMIEKLFSWNMIAEKTNVIYKRVIKRGG